ncbi:putative cation/calcium exchanger 4-like [Capsicum annuum]|nr:putative cation/calcium exchanger 4-like [Capsicum annuum]
MPGVGSGGTASGPSLPPPCPKPPPQYPDLYGKRRELAKVQMLEREIGFLEKELKSIEGLHPASRPCKEVTEFVSEHSDPLIPTCQTAVTAAHLSVAQYLSVNVSPVNCLNAAASLSANGVAAA